MSNQRDTSLLPMWLLCTGVILLSNIGLAVLNIYMLTKSIWWIVAVVPFEAIDIGFLVYMVRDLPVAFGKRKP